MQKFPAFFYTFVQHAKAFSVSPLLIWRTVKPFLPYIAGLALLVGAYLWVDHRSFTRGAHSRDSEVTALNTTITNMKAASAKALATNEANVSRINGLQAQITKDRNDEAPKQIAAGDSAIADWIRLHPAPQANPGGTGKDHASGLSDTTGQPDAALAQTVVPVSDLTACNLAYVTATGLQDWIREQAAIER